MSKNKVYFLLITIIMLLFNIKNVYALTAEEAAKKMNDLMGTAIKGNWTQIETQNADTYTLRVDVGKKTDQAFNEVISNIPKTLSIFTPNKYKASIEIRAVQENGEKTYKKLDKPIKFELKESSGLVYLEATNVPKKSVELATKKGNGVMAIATTNQKGWGGDIESTVTYANKTENTPQAPQEGQYEGESPTPSDSEQWDIIVNPDDASLTINGQTPEQSIQSGNSTGVPEGDDKTEGAINGLFRPEDLCGPDGSKCNLDITRFCNEPQVARTLKFLGLLLFIAKILVPAIIIGMGFMDLVKIVTSGKMDDARKQAINIGKRIAIGVLVFILPTILITIFNVAHTIAYSGVIPDNVTNTELTMEVADFKNCAVCILDPGNCSISG